MSFNGSFNSILNLNYKNIENNIFDDNKFIEAKNKIDKFTANIKDLEYKHIIKYFRINYLSYIVYDKMNYGYYDYYLKSDYYMRFDDEIESKEKIDEEPEYIKKMTTDKEAYLYLVIKIKDNHLIKEKYPFVYTKLKENNYNVDEYDIEEYLAKNHLKRIDNIVLRIGLNLNDTKKGSSIVTVNENKYFDLPQYEIEYFRRLINGCN